MSDVLVSLVVAAGAALFAWSRSGRRMGYSNTQKLLSLLAITFVIVFIMVLLLLETLLHIH